MLDARTTFDWIAEAEAKAEEAVTLVKQMVAWFRDHYEDPVENTPYCSEEGGYIYIWGGPYDAREEIEGHFATQQGAFSEDEWGEIIAAAVDEVEEDGGPEWTKPPPPEPEPDVVRLLRAHDHYWQGPRAPL